MKMIDPETKIAALDRMIENNLTRYFCMDGESDQQTSDVQSLRLLRGDKAVDLRAVFYNGTPFCIAWGEQDLAYGEDYHDYAEILELGVREHKGNIGVVHVAGALVERGLTEGGVVPNHLITKGLPEGAKFVAVRQTRVHIFDILFEHESFPEGETAIAIEVTTNTEKVAHARD